MVHVKSIISVLVSTLSLCASADFTTLPFYPAPSVPAAWPKIPTVPAWAVPSTDRHKPPHSPYRKQCKVKARGPGLDDIPNIIEAARKCNHGGRVILDEEYYAASPADLTFLEDVDLVLSGKITWNNDVQYWQNAGFFIPYQNQTSYWLIGGNNVNIYGGGEISGEGQTFYDAFASNATLLRPILLVIYGARGGSVSNIKLSDGPSWFNLLINSSNFIYDNLHMNAVSLSSNVAKNTDGIDIYRSDNIVFSNSVINNGDDCVSFKPNSTHIIVSNLACNGSHGISVGSLGQYENEIDIVENVYVSNISMSNAQNGARIKVWTGTAAGTSANYNGGDGAGIVRNITYDGMTVNNVDYAIQVTQCYGQSNLTFCAEHPSRMLIQDVLFENFSGTTSGKYKNITTSIVCSAPNLCTNLQADNIDVASPAKYGAGQSQCKNVDTTSLHVNCTASAA
ncbi:hypothetical protein BZG36_01444 [Bifiguratus adelaidae]|uniref:galacturonan 1,4-alpha-galacturonidase n=1 Tax=Bifiguratus adelaidae TaxID=1938954 RepID=A0A261Y4Z0_9FUNG|nr:hypothetical protein BZG36_01444 [Bifiguratus adelaidae]